MAAGKYRHIISLLRPVKTQNQDGEVIKTEWPPWKRARADVQPGTGREFLSANQKIAEVTHTVTTRYFPGALPTMRILFGTRLFKIASVVNVKERNKELAFLCTEVIVAS